MEGSSSEEALDGGDAAGESGATVVGERTIPGGIGRRAQGREDSDDRTSRFLPRGVFFFFLLFSSPSFSLFRFQAVYVYGHDGVFLWRDRERSRG